VEDILLLIERETKNIKTNRQKKVKISWRSQLINGNICPPIYQFIDNRKQASCLDVSHPILFER
jgi:hypothetical protein